MIIGLTGIEEKEIQLKATLKVNCPGSFYGQPVMTLESGRVIGHWEYQAMEGKLLDISMEECRLFNKWIKAC